MVYVIIEEITETIAFIKCFIWPAPKSPPRFFIHSGNFFASLNMNKTNDIGKKKANNAMAKIISIKQKEYFINNCMNLYVKNRPMKNTIICLNKEPIENKALKEKELSIIPIPIFINTWKLVTLV